MTPDTQQFILQNMQQHLAENMGNRITSAMVHGLLAALTIITTERVDAPPKPEEPQP